MDERRHALDVAGRALAARDLSRAALARRLRLAGVEAPARRAVVERLADAGLIDDGRLARRRAQALAGRGYGDAAIDVRLEREGIGRELREAALAELEPEAERARRIVAAMRSGDRRSAGARLARRGFGVDAIEAAIGQLDARDAPELG
jgi:SOS response regulatory protein OraA/RecX